MEKYTPEYKKVLDELNAKRKQREEDIEAAKNRNHEIFYEDAAAWDAYEFPTTIHLTRRIDMTENHKKQSSKHADIVEDKTYAVFNNGNLLFGSFSPVPFGWTFYEHSGLGNARQLNSLDAIFECDLPELPERLVAYVEVPKPLDQYGEEEEEED